MARIGSDKKDPLVRYRSTLLYIQLITSPGGSQIVKCSCQAGMDDV